MKCFAREVHDAADNEPSDSNAMFNRLGPSLTDDLELEDEREPENGI